MKTLTESPKIHAKERQNADHTQKKSATKAVFADHRHETPFYGYVQQMADNSPQATQIAQLQHMANSGTANRTGLPDHLKAGIENLSGYAMDDVRVHYNSDKPAGLQAHAYAQGTNIHIAPGQEQHLPHEAWHVVQQKQGRVQPTLQMKGGVDVNDDASLEKEADVMGSKALTQPQVIPVVSPRATGAIANTNLHQLGKRVKKESREERLQRILNRIRQSNTRNKTSKARPKRFRAMYNRQQKFNYGFPGTERHKRVTERGDSQALVPYNPLVNPDIKPQHTQVDFGGVNTYFYRFYGGQPFVRVDTKSFEDSAIKSNYDDIINHFHGKDAEVAFEILQTIETNKDLDSTIDGQAKTMLIFLTQIIEAHDTRIPGTDKLARALLRRIALGQLTFQEAFNRKNGLFVSAWAKAAGAPQGGQMAGRALFGTKRDQDKYDVEQLEDDLGEDRIDDLMDTVDGYYSDDSEDESGISPDEKHDHLEMHGGIIKSVNDALKTLGMSLSISNAAGLLMLSQHEKAIDTAYRARALQHHPDQGGDSEMFNTVSDAVSLLKQWIAELSESKTIDFGAKEQEKQLSGNGLKLAKIKGDGNCFYAAILDQIAYHGGTVPSAQMLRDRIAQLIIDNADVFQVFVTGGQLNQIVESILTSHSWNNMGGDFAPQLIASVLRRPVRIVQPDGIIDIAPRNDLTLNVHNTLFTGSNALITIAYNGNNHYDSTRQNFLQL